MALLLFISLRRRELNFEHLLHPMALVIILSLSVTFFFPGSAVVGVVLVGVAFQLFDVVTWYMFSYIVYQSKASAVQVVALGRAIIALGVTMGDALGARCAGMGIEDAPLATAVFVLLFAAVIAVFFVFPERQVDKLLLPIPDEDDEAWRLLMRRRSRRWRARTRQPQSIAGAGSSCACSWATSGS